MTENKTNTTNTNTNEVKKAVAPKTTKEVGKVFRAKRYYAEYDPYKIRIRVR